MKWTRSQLPGSRWTDYRATIRRLVEENARLRLGVEACGVTHLIESKRCRCCGEHARFGEDINHKPDCPAR